ncbi:MAG: iron ABC transporter permease, partial [Rhodococcus fascians]
MSLRLLLWVVVSVSILAPIAAVVSIGLGGNHVRELIDGGIVDAAVNSVVSAGLSALFAVVIAVAMA